jgi:type II secretory pathway pseudopilin PulG
LLKTSQKSLAILNRKTTLTGTTVGASLTELLLVLLILLVLGSLLIPPMVDAFHAVKDLLAMASQAVVR